MVVKQRNTIRERLERMTERVPWSGCWIFTGTLCKGYGLIREDAPSRSMPYAHRVAYELTHGPIPPGLCVLHRCDVPCCVNPDHLWIGDSGDNIRDAIAKGRHAAPEAKGSENGFSKLTEDKVREILALNEPIRQIAARFNIDKTVIYKIKGGKLWRHVSRT